MEEKHAVFSTMKRGGDKPDYIAFWCPGCKRPHVFDVSWQIDWDDLKPSVSPSILVTNPDKSRCHLFIKKGMIQFCGDSHHELAGQTVACVPWDEVNDD